MGSIRVRKDSGALFFDFIYKGVRCRELTTLKDNTENRKNMEKMLKKMEAEMLLGQFDYSKYFPTSSMVKKLTECVSQVATADNNADTPTLKKFAEEWHQENTVRWKRSYQDMVQGIIDKYLLPAFGDKKVGSITKGEILKFRSTLAKDTNGTDGLSPDRINHIMTPLRMMLSDAADRYQFTTPCLGIKQLKVPHTDVHPFSLDEVNRFLAQVRTDFRNYYTVRFFTGMRTSEIDGLKWEYVDFDRRQIHIRETIVGGRMESTKTLSSIRSIDMSQIVYDALKSQWDVTSKLSPFVFCNANGSPLRYCNITNRIWIPTLLLLGLKVRRAYETRHTTATLWLAAGENPEWVARQLGHANTKMLFTIYSRFIPNLTRQDGSAFERLLMTKQNQEVSNDHQ